MTLNDKKVINGWAMYDWANSVYSLVITSTIFPIYYASVTETADGKNLVNFFGAHITNTVLYSYSISFSFLVLALLMPILSGIADYSGNKKSFMKFFAYLGSASCAGLFFFQGPANIEYGIACSVMASIGFGGSLVFYNAYLPEITTPDNYDRVSAKGFALGYFGSVLLMILNLMMVQHKQWFGFTDIKGTFLGDPGLPARAVFVTVGLWWFGFSQITFARLPKGVAKQATDNILSKGFQELAKVWKSLKTLPKTRNFLIAFFFYDMGVQTIMLLAATYGSDKLKLDSGVLIMTILVIQIVAIGGAYIFAWVSKLKGNIFSLSFMIVMWVMACTSIFFINGPTGAAVQARFAEKVRTETARQTGSTLTEARRSELKKEALKELQKPVETQFIIIGFWVGLIMGGIQSLSRATYSKLLPETEDHASYFSFYDVCEKVCIVLGVGLFGYMQQITGDMRNSVWPLLVAFIIGFIVLQFAKNRAVASPQG
jgi:UMF1 family MFS transporter